MDGRGCRNAKLVAASSGGVDLTQRQAVERSVSVSANRSQVRSDDGRRESVNGGTRAHRARNAREELRHGASPQSARTGGR